MLPRRPPRLFRAPDILAGRVNLDGYPFRYICVGPTPSTVLDAGLRGQAGSNDLLDEVLTAAEVLESRGWEVAGFDQGGLFVFLRRRGR